jgi:predicted dehydrogenase
MTTRTNHTPPEHARKVRYAVVGLGKIAQEAVLPAFLHARRNTQLVGLVSQDRRKMQRLARKYRAAHTWTYEEYADCLQSGAIDAVYIALPNSMHCEFAVRAADAGIHVLCEKPLALNEKECAAMIAAAETNGVKLMTAYRLHFERANTQALEIVRSGKIGDPLIFQSTFTLQVKDPGNIRLRKAVGGGTLYDIGVYCINAARHVFQDEPTEVTCVIANGDEPRFNEVEATATAVLRFPNERLATFTCSFGASDVSSYTIVGTKGDLRLRPAYEYKEELEYVLTANGRSRTKRFPVRDQFAPELLHFSECIREGRDPGPSGREGYADVRVIRALYRSAENHGELIELGTPDTTETSLLPNLRVEPVLLEARKASATVETRVESVNASARGASVQASSARPASATPRGASASAARSSASASPRQPSSIATNRSRTQGG